MKGAKPKQNAMRRKQKDSYGIAAPQEQTGVVIPDDIAADPVQSEIWNWIAPPVNSFTAQDIPNLRMLCYWHAVAMQAQQAIHSESGAISIFDTIDVKPFLSEDGKKIPLVRKSPALTVLKEASAEIRAYSDQLGLSPLARSRIGLMDATKTKTAADTAALFKSIDAAYGLSTSDVLEVKAIEAD